MFNDLLDGVKYGNVNPGNINPFQCIPLTINITTSKYRVKRLIHLYNSDTATSDCTTALAIGSDTPNMFALTGSLFHHVTTYFCKNKYLRKALSQFPVWYGIIDGDDRNKAVLHLLSNNPAWASYKWFVTILRGGHSMDRYVQLARFSNHRPISSLDTKMTFYNEVINLRHEYERLCTHNKKPTNFEVAKEYFETGTTNRTMTMMSSISVRLPRKLIN